MPSQRHQLELFADYFQFYIADRDFETDTGLLWDDETTDRMLAVGKDLIAVGTARNMEVPVTLEISEREPELDFEAWEQVIECGVIFASGVLVALGCTDYLPDAAQFEVEPGRYRARISYTALDTLSEDGLDGDDRYRVQLWPGAADSVTVVKDRAR